MFPDNVFVATFAQADTSFVAEWNPHQNRTDLIRTTATRSGTNTLGFPTRLPLIGPLDVAHFGLWRQRLSLGLSILWEPQRTC